MAGLQRLRRREDWKVDRKMVDMEKVRWWKEGDGSGF